VELRHLRYFIAVAEELHFGRAARRVGIAQPPLSQQIRRLEEEVHTALLRRTKRNVQLTEAGRLFLDEARATLAQVERAVRLAQRASRGEIGQLSVGFVPWADFTSIPKMIRTFGERHPDVDVELHSLTSQEQVAALRHGDIDVGIMRPPVSGDDLLTEPLFSEPLVVAFPRGHRFTTYEQIPWRELTSEAFIAFSRERTTGYDALLVRACHDAGITLRVRHEADHPQTILALVEAGIGVSLVPASFARVKRPGISHRGLRPIGPALETIIVWRRDNESPLLRAFLEVVHEIANAVLARPKQRSPRRVVSDPRTPSPI
jgi:DNA-binding transcriptional LysR family regulator